MVDTPFVAPSFSRSAYNCPNCLAYAHQDWYELKTIAMSAVVPGLRIAYCGHCKQYSVWHYGKMVSPESVTVGPSNTDLTEEIRADYAEAASIVTRSPRSAAGLLRLALQKLLSDQLKAEGGDLNAKIGWLVKECGLSIKVQQALDSLRVVGNNALHPGQIDLKDDTETAYRLFAVINIIADELLTKPKEISELFDTKVPEKQKEQIRKRDEK